MRSFALLAGVGVVAAKTITITAGQGGLSFSPSSSTASVGDILEFHFIGSIHSAVQGDFSNPCQSNGGFDSGTVKNTASGDGSVFQVTVKDTNPIWFFCATVTHCQGGMAGVVNPASGQSLSDYQSAAAGTSSSSPASGPKGGNLVAFPFVSSASSPASSPAPSPASSPASKASSSVASPPSSSVAASSVSPGSSAPAAVSPPNVVISPSAVPPVVPPGTNATVTGAPPVKSSPPVVTSAASGTFMSVAGVLVSVALWTWSLFV